MIDLSDVPVIDNHVHPWRESAKDASGEEIEIDVTFADAVVTSVRFEYLPEQQLAAQLRLFRKTSLNTLWMRNELARFLGVEETWQAIGEARLVAARDYRAWAERLFRDVRIDTLLIDEGGARPKRILLEELNAIAPARYRRVARIDNWIRDGLEKHDTWSGFYGYFRTEIDAAIADGSLAFKSVTAYRTGLDVTPVSEDVARRNFDETHSKGELLQKPFRDFLVCHAMDVARERGLWFHIHAATGDPDIIFQKSNPGHLYPLLHSERFRANRVVLVHGGWPWVSEAAVMVGMLPNVYLDVSEGSIFGMSNLRQRIHEAMECAPYAKILYSSDGHTPETVWVVAKRYKSALGRVLAELVTEGFFSSREAYRAGEMIMNGNAARLYSL